MSNFDQVKGKITLHGLGFIQIKLTDHNRLHIWHPDLPKRKCHQYSSIHNHRFSFKSTILKGTLFNTRYVDFIHKNEDRIGLDFKVINHDGERLATGSRKSFYDGFASIDEKALGIYSTGDTYEVKEGDFHKTEFGLVPAITFMQKTSESKIHAKSLIHKSFSGKFDMDFDRYQLNEKELFEFVVDAMKY